MGRHAIKILMLCLLAMVGLAGCGGSNSPYRGETEFRGAWAGNWAVAGTNDSGVMTLTVSDSATMQGTFTNYGTGETGMVRGATNPDGGFNMTFTPDGAGAAININGIMSMNTGTRPELAADGTWTRPASAARGFTFDLTTTNPVEHPLAGPYNGIWEVSGTTDTGVWNITIGQNGQLAGSFTNTGTGRGGRIEGNVLQNGEFVGAMVENGTGTRYELQGVMSRNGTNGLAADGTFTRPGGQPEGFTFTSEIPDGGTTGG